MNNCMRSNVTTKTMLDVESKVCLRALVLVIDCVCVCVCVCMRVCVCVSACVCVGGGGGGACMQAFLFSSLINLPGGRIAREECFHSLLASARMHTACTQAGMPVHMHACTHAQTQTHTHETNSAKGCCNETVTVFSYLISTNEPFSCVHTNNVLMYVHRYIDLCAQIQ